MTRPCPSRRRAAFSLVETLVVTAVMAAILGMLLPAVQKVRAASAASQCRNHLKQIALATANHLDAKGYYPTGGNWQGNLMVNPGVVWVGGAPADPPAQTAGWGFQLLPYMEQDAIYRTPDEEAVRRHLVSAYFCPARRRPTRVPGSPRPGPWASLDYAAVSPADHRYNLGTGVVVNNAYGAVRAAHLMDGASATVVFSEKRLRPTRYLSGGDPWDDQGYVAGWDFDIIRSAGLPPQPDAEAMTGYDLGSAHRSGLHAAFADGSVRHLSYGINTNTLTRLADRQDGLVVSQSQY